MSSFPQKSNAPMRKHRKRFVAIATSILAIVAVAWGIQVWRIPQPNILLITLDTTRADRIGCYGYDRVETPHLDELARRGVLFERAYATAPMTAPSHASMFTGLHPPEHGVYTNGIVALEPDVPVLAEYLQRAGYATSAFVASVVLQTKSGLNRGFEHYDDDLSSAEKGGDELHQSRDGAHVVDAAVGWLKNRRHQSAPFFCWVHLFDPHEPYLTHDDVFGEAYRDRPYDGEIAYVDRQIGRLFDSLDELGLSKDMVIVVVGDHGESLGEHGEETHGYMLHETTLRVPLIVADPRLEVKNRRVSTPVSLVDLFPTLFDLAGLPQEGQIARRSLHPALLGEPLSSRICYSQTLEPYIEARWSPLRGLTTDRWRYVRTSIPELYDLQIDPSELKNLAEEQADLVVELDGELAFLEDGMQPRTGRAVTLSGQEQRALESLSYAGGSITTIEELPDGRLRPDIKEMIGPLNLYIAATELIERKKFDEAIVILLPLADQVPEFVRVQYSLGLCYIGEEKYADAVQPMEAALEVDPHYERARILLGYAHLKLQQYPQAKQHLQQVIESNPDAEDAHLYLGELYQRQKQFPLALRHYEEVLRINPRNVFARELVPVFRAAIGNR
ncbi:MAG: sulfatase-like hydrolase/transferase [Planctomycetota bacterium]|nr:sulfatase-like hydrolase/transferase [Planctomycetota bacterium]MDA1213915.1 sulfatase-like hydrolase/transferase [Planctomycetota bacterium]